MTDGFRPGGPLSHANRRSLRAGHRSSQHERLSGQSEAYVIDHCLNSLGRLLHLNPAQLQEELAAAYFHDWLSDPFSRGAYSYGKVGAVEAQQALGAPLEDTLFFAGEATDVSGNNGTVHGAIASGYRAAAEILRTTSTR